MRFPIQFISHQMSINFIGKRWVGFTISLMAIGLSFISLAINGLNFGIDFSGGIVIEVRDNKEIDLASYRSTLHEAGFPGLSLQNIGTKNDLMIRLQAKPGENHQEVISRVKQVVATKFGSQVEFRKVDFVGPQVSTTLARNSAIAVLTSLLGIMAYLWFRFNWQYGVGGIAALFHDAIVTLGFYSITGYEFDLTSIAAILTVIGYSINDSVVIYDRVRENLRKFKKKPIEEILNMSINETLSRTLLAVSTVLLACLALILFGGEVIKAFSLAMFIGILAGTHSSIYVSAPILIYTGVGRQNFQSARPEASRG